MDFKKFIDECKKYLEGKGVSLEEIKDFNKDTLLCDDCNSFYGYHGTCKNYEVSLMYYEEEPNYNYAVIMALEKDSTDIHYYEELSLINQKRFSDNDETNARQLIDDVIDCIKNS